MGSNTSYFFCGIGGSGMLPLALVLKSRGAGVSGSDRSLDQGRTPEKFAFLHACGIDLFPQDGSGIAGPDTTVVASAAVEDTVPDMVAAHAAGARRITRAELLSELFNASPLRIGVAGTSGKSTTTGMIAWILHACGLAPTVVNGAVMKNFVTEDMPFASAIAEGGDAFVAEVDESDGSIARYVPTVAVLNNIAHDHKSMAELRTLFGDFLARAEQAVVNFDNAQSRALADALPHGRVLGYSLKDPSSALFADEIVPAPDGMTFSLHGGGLCLPAQLCVPGRYNVANALAAMGAALCAGIPLGEAADALADFTGIRRRMETVGTRGGVTVIDDFAHNPDKIAASLSALHAFPGRLLVLFQPQGFGPLKLLKDEFVECFVAHLTAEDVLVMPDPAYFGGTVDRAVRSEDIVAAVAAAGRQAGYFADRKDGGAHLLGLARPGDRIVVMGARDDSLSDFAEALLKGIAVPV